MISPIHVDILSAIIGVAAIIGIIAYIQSQRRKPKIKRDSTTTTRRWTTMSSQWRNKDKKK
jgi:hypothetical protein